MRRYGWIPDLPDHRDYEYAAPRVAKLPASVDLRPQAARVYDQGELGSCTANAIAAAMAYGLKKQGAAPIALSRLFVYYNEREMEGSVNYDSGAHIRDGIKSVVKLGACLEAQWPYLVDRFARQPPSYCYAEALLHQVERYLRVGGTLYQMRACLAEGFPFVFGFTVYESFDSDEVAKTGVLQMPATSESAMGGHAVLCMGYDDAAQRFLVQNSWGTEWGQSGFFTMPYEYVTNPNLADDRWTIRLVEA